MQMDRSKAVWAGDLGLLGQAERCRRFDGVSSFLIYPNFSPISTTHCTRFLFVFESVCCFAFDVHHTFIIVDNGGRAEVPGGRTSIAAKLVGQCLAAHDTMAEIFQCRFDCE